MEESVRPKFELVHEVGEHGGRGGVGGVGLDGSVELAPEGERDGRGRDGRVGLVVSEDPDSEKKEKRGQKGAK